ncbi:S41 family peptidase [Paenibacillus herberti]|uniref:Peptidase S41 n=1 Tax=Paenibacillus herberti TaxID=1619309 RepID=A0A229P563_9BACL|nr:S41 family peptidase [Paenibacillus herberti]OXM17258.1 peptidase S41 [Paenibacillus herberti]
MRERSTAARQRLITWCVVGAAAALIVGFTAGRLSMLFQYPVMKEKVFSNFNAAYKEIKSEYLFDTKPDALMNGATKGMLASLEDPYSVYLPGSEGQDFVQSYQPEFVGIGVQVREEEGRFLIDTVIKETPADKGGVLAGDELIKVDGTALEGFSMEKLVAILRGEKGTKVKVTLARAGNPEMTIELTRAPIPVTTVTHAMLKDGIGQITISRFAESTAKEFDKSLKALQDKGMKELVVDLRSNPGGLLNPTIDIASRLIPKGKLILEVDYKDDKKVQKYSSKQEKKFDLPIVVLVNSQTASAGEVLAAALKESGGATIIGTTTFGKGIVQSFGQFKDKSVLKLTEAEWKTPAGKSIHKKGVEPDQKVELPAYASLPMLPTGEEMKQGDYGDFVKTLQTMLEALGYGAAPVPGVFAEQTAEAVRSFQKSSGLEANGIVSDRTSYALMEQLREQLQKDDPQLKAALAKLGEAGK